MEALLLIWCPMQGFFDEHRFICNLQEHPEWEIKNGFVIFQKAKESAPCKDIPSLQLINQTLSYARELERVV
ncbi:hypothetical protein CsSME_00050725 [Camellia sinensis var. sinensis]